MIRLRAVFGLLALAGASGSPVTASAYDLSAHALITARAVGGAGSTVDQVLKTLGFPRGIETSFKLLSEEHRMAITKNATEWLQEGAKQEDQPSKRVANHFHNPMAPAWAEAGLSVSVPLRAASARGQSSLLWQQNRGQNTWRISGTFLGASVSGRLEGGDWSWPDATRLYYEALTLEPKPAREASLAKALRALGQVVHLIQDASLPAHTRNDPHVYFEILGMDIGNPDGYERWVDRNLRAPVVLQALSVPMRPSTQIFSLAGNAARIDRTAAPSPIFRLIDTGQYVGNNPEILVGDLVGLSEYSNGNFFSNDTISLRKPEILTSLSHPAPTDLFLRPEPEEVPDRPAERRRYFQKLVPGESVQYAALPGALYDYLPAALRDRNTTLDPKVYAEHAAKLLPRAVGYSAALLDYFFRGKLDTRIERQWDGVSAYRLYIEVVNGMERETMTGDFWLYYDRADGTRTTLPGWSLNRELRAGQGSGLIELPPLPSDVSPATPLLLVFRGRLGESSDVEEPDAVIAAPVALGAYQLLVGHSIDPTSDFGQLSLLDSLSFATPVAYQFFVAAGASAGMVVGLLNGTGSSGNSLYFYRSFGVAPGDVATIMAGGACFSTVFQGLGAITEGRIDPVIAEIVALTEPENLEALYGYAGFSPPSVARVLHTFTAFPGEAGVHQATIDITGVSFFGIRLVSQPVVQPPPPPPDGFVNSSSASCHVGASVTIPR